MVDRIPRSGKQGLTDGGRTIRSQEACRRRADCVRYYSADGNLRALRDGDEHVVTADGWEETDQWTKRVPAERTAVLPEEQLWTIPDNWQHEYTVKTSQASQPSIYHIPETGVDVRVTHPTNDTLGDAWISVGCVGEVTTSEDAALDPAAITTVLEEPTAVTARPDHVIEALAEIHQKWQAFETAYRAEVEQYAPRMLEGHDSIPSSSFESWQDIFTIEDLILDVCDVTSDVAADLEQTLWEIDAVPRYPEIRAEVASHEPLPTEYQLRAVTGVGCSLQEAVDFLAVETGQMTAAEWANTSDRDETTIDANIDAAQNALSA